MRKEKILAIISFAFVLLFLYTALAKLFTYSFYLHDLQRSPWLGTFALPLSIAVPAVELLTATFLLIPMKRRLGFLFSAILMTLFTIYVAAVLAFSDTLPCTCGGIIRELSWPQHLVFNISFTILAFIGYKLTNQFEITIKSNSAVIRR